MAISFPGTRGIRYDFPTPNFRFAGSADDLYPNGISGGQWIVSFWMRPRDISTTQELIAVLDGTTAAFGACFFIIRLEGGFDDGTILVIMQSKLFGFCTVRRTDPNAVVADVWQHVAVKFDTNGGAGHIYINGVEATYAFSRDETLLAPFGGSYIVLGSTIDGHSGGPVYARGTRIASGDPANGNPAKQFTTTLGTSYDGDMSDPGFWHSGPISGDPDDFIPMLADGYSPLFLHSRLEGSTQTHSLLMAPPLAGEEIDEEADPITGAIPLIESGSGTITWTDGPGMVYPADPDDPSPGVPRPTLPKLCLPFGMPRAEIYSNPGNPADILPVVYGDFQVAGIRGPVPAVLIDKGEDNLGPWVFCAAFHPVISIDDVYIGDIKQTTGFTINLSDNFQNQGTIASITFDAQPQDQVSWRGQGHHADDGVTLMENCVEQLVHLLTTFGNFSREDDFEAGSLAEAIAAVTAMDYRTAFVVKNEQVTQDWLTEMLFNVMGYWRVNGREQVEIHIDTGGTPARSDIMAHLIASRDCLDGDDGVSYVLDRRWLVNRLTADYCWSYSLHIASHRVTGIEDALSIEAYGPMDKVVTLIGLRRAADVLIWGIILLLRQSAQTRVEGNQVRMKVFGSRVAHVTVGDYISFSWPYGPTREFGKPYVNEILRVVDLKLDTARGGAVEIIAVDLGVYLTGPDGTRELEPYAA